MVLWICPLNYKYFVLSLQHLKHMLFQSTGLMLYTVFPFLAVLASEYRVHLFELFVAHVDWSYGFITFLYAAVMFWHCLSLMLQIPKLPDIDPQLQKTAQLASDVMNRAPINELVQWKLPGLKSDDATPQKINCMYLFPIHLFWISCPFRTLLTKQAKPRKIFLAGPLRVISVTILHSLIYMRYVGNKLSPQSMPIFHSLIQYFFIYFCDKADGFTAWDCQLAILTKSLILTLYRWIWLIMYNFSASIGV